MVGLKYRPAESGKEDFMKTPQLFINLRGGQLLTFFQIMEESGITISDIESILRGDKKITLVDLSANILAEKLPVAISYSRMLQLLESTDALKGKFVVTPKTLKELFSVELVELPPIAAPEWKIKRLAELGCFFYYWPEEGWTMKRLYETLTPIYKERDWGKVLYNTDWYGSGKEKFFIEPIPVGWRAMMLIPGTGGKNFLQQTQILMDFVCKGVFARKKLSSEVLQAKDELEKSDKEISNLIEGDGWQKGAQILAGLKINQMFCPSPAEELLFSAIVRAQTGKNIFNSIYGWTSALSSDGRLVLFGGSNAGGAAVYDWRPRGSDGYLRRFFLCRF